MALKHGRNRNTNDESNMEDGVTLNATTSVTILAANPERIALHVNNNDSLKGCWIKFQAASVDNDKKGIFLNASGLGGSTWDMSPDNNYTGEVSAISDSGAPVVFITEY